MNENKDTICDSVECTCGHNHKKDNTPKAFPVTSRMKIGRNQKCICGSGKKYKNCCLKS